jgi:hypothetical protein
MKKKKTFNRQHIQHTSKFISELNSVTNSKPYTPFRISDETWLVGKYKGAKLDDIPKSYIGWVLNNFNLTSTASSILKNKL